LQSSEVRLRSAGSWGLREPLEPLYRPLFALSFGFSLRTVGFSQIHSCVGFSPLLSGRPGWSEVSVVSSVLCTVIFPATVISAEFCRLTVSATLKADQLVDVLVLSFSPPLSHFPPFYFEFY